MALCKLCQEVGSAMRLTDIENGVGFCFAVVRLSSHFLISTVCRLWRNKKHPSCGSEWSYATLLWVVELWRIVATCGFWRLLERWSCHLASSKDSWNDPSWASRSNTDGCQPATPAFCLHDGTLCSQGVTPPQSQCHRGRETFRMHSSSR